MKATRISITLDVEKDANPRAVRAAFVAVAVEIGIVDATGEALYNEGRDDGAYPGVSFHWKRAVACCSDGRCPSCDPGRL